MYFFLHVVVHLCWYSIDKGSDGQVYKIVVAKIIVNILKNLSESL